MVKLMLEVGTEGPVQILWRLEYRSFFDSRSRAYVLYPSPGGFDDARNLLAQ